MFSPESDNNDKSQEPDNQAKNTFYTEIRACFPLEIIIPDNILENLFEQVEGWARDAESLEDEVDNSKNYLTKTKPTTGVGQDVSGVEGRFLGWNHLYVVKFVSKRMGVQYRPFNYESNHSDDWDKVLWRKKGKGWQKVLWHKVKGLIVFSDDPFEQSGKAYIGLEIRRQILTHSTINRVANIASAFLGVEAGRVFGYKILEIAGKNKTVETFLGVLINGAIFWVLTSIAEYTITHASCTKREIISTIKPFVVLLAVTTIKLYSIFQAALGGALDMSPVDKVYLISTYTKNYMAEIENNLDKENKALDDLEKLRTQIADITIRQLKSEYNISPELSKKEKENISAELKKKREEFEDVIKGVGKNPDVVITKYKDILDSDIILRVNEALLQALPEEERQKARRNTLQLQKQDTVDNRRDLYEDIATEMRAYGIEVSLPKVNNENIKWEKNIATTRPVTKTGARVTENKKFLEQNDPETFIRKYFPSQYGQAFTNNLLYMIEKADMSELPIGDRFHILQEKLGYEMTHGLFPTLLAVAAIAIFLEGMSTYTLWSVMTSPKYKMLFSNRSFQESMTQVNAILIRYIKMEYKKDNPENHIKIGSSEKVRPLVTSKVWEGIITQIVREGANESVNALVETYTKESFDRLYGLRWWKKIFSRYGRKKSTENQTTQANDVRNQKNQEDKK